MSEYYIYHNWHRDRVRVHRAGCRYCNGGKGSQPASSRVHDEWLGPFDRDQAFLAARKLRRDDVAACTACRP